MTIIATDPLLLVLSGLLFFVLILYTLIDGRQRSSLLGVFGGRKQRATDTFTPPRSLSPEKQKQGLQSNESSSPTYEDVFPPCRRHVLEQCKLYGHGPSAEELSKQAPDYSQSVPDKETADAQMQCTTPTGFTVGEIKRLGDFPDYASLSGVPLPQASDNSFDITKAKPRPYRPLRWAYHQTMSLTKLDSDFWLELESSYVERIAQRQELFQKYGSEVLQALPGSKLALKELMEMCIQFYCTRYPQYFRLEEGSSVFHNGVLHTSTDIKATEPLQFLLNNVPEDFACMIRDPATGIYSFRAGIICSSLGWTVGSKIGLKLHEIHAPIPDYKEKMQFSMDRYFAKMPTDKPIQRGSWGLEIDEPLFMPPDDPHEKLREAQNPLHTIEQCHLRVDWQTLRRLPLSGSIVFNFKGLFTPVTEFANEPYIPALLLKVLKEGKANMMEYKNTWHTEHLVIPAMEKYAQQQVVEGLVEENWEPHTLEEAPFFPGWEEKWQRQQGF